ncbi:MAG TPA: ABC transporter permease [Bacteroidota bacterium]|nr:ABC transporter permease [Bacteroidota bacterium]
MKKIIAVARWEYLEKIKSKAFLISLFLMPLIMIAVGVLPVILADRPDSETRVIGIIDETKEIYQPLIHHLEERFKLSDGRPNYFLRSIGDEMESFLDKKIQADSLVISEEIQGYIIIRSSVMDDSLFEYRSSNVGNIRMIENIKSAVRDIIIEKRLRSQGLDPDIVKELTSPLEMRTIKLSKTGKEEESGFGQIFFTAYTFVMMMMFLVLTSGQLLIRSMLEEKSNRVVEILMSSCSATQLMAGKIIGLSGLGLTQIGFWAIIGLAISIKFAITMISLSSAFILLIYFLLGYLLYAAIFVAAGSPVSTEQEAQQLTTYITLILVMPIVLALPVMQDPDSTLVKVLSFIPLLTPTMMALRIPIQMPSTMEVLLTIVLLSASVVGAIWAAGKIFRTAILIYGKRPTLFEIVKLLQTS